MTNEWDGRHPPPAPKSQLPQDALGRADAPEPERCGVRVPLAGSEWFALVDDCDADRVLSFRWSLNATTVGRQYAQRYVMLASGKRSTQSLHRFVMSATAGQVVDHISGNGLDNRRENLRFCSESQNCQNRKRSKAERNGGYKGVARVAKGGWTAQLQEPGMRALGKRGYLGFFKTAEAAARAYDARAIAVFGEFASLNFPNQTAELCSCDESKALRERLARLEGGA